MPNSPPPPNSRSSTPVSPPSPRSDQAAGNQLVQHMVGGGNSDQSIQTSSSSSPPVSPVVPRPGVDPNVLMQALRRLQVSESSSSMSVNTLQDEILTLRIEEAQLQSNLTLLESQATRDFEVEAELRDQLTSLNRTMIRMRRDLDRLMQQAQPSQEAVQEEQGASASGELMPTFPARSMQEATALDRLTKLTALGLSQEELGEMPAEILQARVSVLEEDLAELLVERTQLRGEYRAAKAEATDPTRFVLRQALRGFTAEEAGAMPPSQRVLQAALMASELDLIRSMQKIRDIKIILVKLNQLKAKIISLHDELFILKEEMAKR